MQIVKPNGELETRPVSQGDVVGKKVFKRTSKNIYLGNPIQHPGEHNELASVEAQMYLTGEILIIGVEEWKSL